MAGVPEAAHGVPLRFKYSSGINRTRRFVLSESIQVGHLSTILSLLHDKIQAANTMQCFQF